MDYFSSTVLELTLVNSVHVFLQWNQDSSGQWYEHKCMEVLVIVIATRELRIYGENEKIHAHHLSSEWFAIERKKEISIEEISNISIRSILVEKLS